MASQHTAEFRQEAVRVALSSGLGRKHVAADFGVGFSTLSRWIHLDRKELVGPTAQSDLEAEVARLRKENRRLREKRHPEPPRVYRRAFVQNLGYFIKGIQVCI